MAYGEKVLARADAAHARRNDARRARREGRTSGDYALAPTGVRRTCEACCGIFDEVDLIPGQALCLHCHIALEAEAVADTSGPRWLQAAGTHVIIQLMAVGFVASLYELVRPDQAFGFHMVVTAAAMAGTVIALNHGKQAPGRHWVGYPVMGFHAVALGLWPLSVALGHHISWALKYPLLHSWQCTLPF